MAKSFYNVKVADILKMPTEEIAKLTKEESISLERRLRQITKSRLKTFEKKGYTSPVYERIFGDELPKVSKRTSTRQSIQHKIAMYRSFFEGKTSTFSGLKKILNEQEKRIFGNNDGFGDEESRKRFWRAYNEFMHQNPRFYDESDKVQKQLADMSFWRNRSFNADDLMTLLNKVEQKGSDFRADIR